MRKLRDFIARNRATFMIIPAGTKSIKQIRFNFLVVIAVLLSILGVNVFMALKTVRSQSVAHALNDSNTKLYSELVQEQDKIRSLEDISASANIEIKALKEKLSAASDFVEQRLAEIEDTESKLKELVSLFNQQTNSNIEIPVSRSFNRNFGSLPNKDAASYNEVASAGDSDIVRSAKSLSSYSVITGILESKNNSLADLKNSLEGQLEYLSARPDYLPTIGVLTSPFGMREDPFERGVMEFHNGIDIANRIGTEIYASGAGEVITSEFLKRYGNVVIIHHGYGYTTVYAHCSELLVKVGDRVKKGQKIALMGSTGRSTGPHLHFEIRYEGKPINPQTLVGK